MLSADRFMEVPARRRAFRPIFALAPQLDGGAKGGEPQMTQIYDSITTLHSSGFLRCYQSVKGEFSIP